MRKQILTALAAVALCAAGFTTVMANSQPVLKVDAVATASAPATAAAVDVKNTKCMVMADDDVTDGKTVTYEGKIYHFCCGKCIKAFNKDPEKYIKLFDADPAAYGVKK